MTSFNSKRNPWWIILVLAGILLMLLWSEWYVPYSLSTEAILIWVSISLVLTLLIVLIRNNLSNKIGKRALQQAEHKLVKSQRLYFFLSQINQAIVKMENEAGLYNDLCKISVEIGQFKMAWIGALETATGLLKPVVFAGHENGYLDGIEISISGKKSKGPSGTAIREGKYVVCNDIWNAPEMSPWRDAALERGYQSSISLPIFKNNIPIGAFSLYADTPHFFDEAEVKLLQEAAADVSFALNMLEKEKDRQQAVAALYESQLRYQTLTDVAPVGIFHTDATGYTTYVNPRWCTISGLTATDAKGNGWLKAVHPEDTDIVKEGWTKASSQKLPSSTEYRFLKADGNIAWVMGQAVPEYNQEGAIIGYVGTITDITQRKLAEQKAEKLYKENQNILSRIKEGMVSLDNNWCYTFMNEAAAAFHPINVQETIGSNIWEVHPEMKGTIFWDKYHEAMNHKKVVSFQNYYQPMNKWFAVKIYPSSDGLTIFFNDITEQVLNEEKNLLNEARLRKAQEIGKLGYWQMEINSSTIWASDEAMRIYGFPAVEGKIRSDKITERIIDIDIVRAAVKKMLIDHLPYRIQIRIKPTADKISHILAMAELLLDENGAPIRIMGVLQDITAQVITQEEVVKEKYLSDTIINSLPGIFYLYNQDGKFFRWNKNFETVTEYSSDEIATMVPLDFYDVPEKSLLKEKIQNVFQQGEDAVEALFLTKSGKKIPYYFTGCRLQYGDQPCLLGIGIDFSVRQQALEALGKITQQLRELTIHLQSVREEERKRIGREIHDELGQQLTAIKMDVVWLDKKVDPSEEALKSKLKNVIALLDGSNQSVRRILSELRPLVLDDRGLIDALQWLGEQFSSNNDIEVTFDSQDFEAQLSEEITTSLFRIYQEALTNISRYANAKKVHSSIKIDDGSVLLHIYDDGVGFDPDILQQKKSFGILGMKERVNALGGIFTLHTAIGKGTHLMVRIPI